MACRIADNPPLQLLMKDIGVQPRCHSYRAGCVHGLPAPSKDQFLGTTGAAIGYCQALFNRLGTARENTSRIVGLLQEIDAPWHSSHELFFGHVGKQQPAAFVNDASEPLIGSGRVPILITELDLDQDLETIRSIISSNVSAANGETVLLRVTISNRRGIQNLVRLVSELVETSFKAMKCPTWWPLLQGDIDPSEWRALKTALGSLWKYANIAMNPFFDMAQLEEVIDQITVAQVPVGLREGILGNGRIQLDPRMVRLTGALSPDAHYQIDRYADHLSELAHAPTLIVLGPSLPEWSDQINQDRLAALLPHLKSICEEIWSSLPAESRTEVWRMAA